MPLSCWPFCYSRPASSIAIQDGPISSPVLTSASSVQKAVQHSPNKVANKTKQDFQSPQSPFKKRLFAAKAGHASSVGGRVQTIAVGSPAVGSSAVGSSNDVEDQAQPLSPRKSLRHYPPVNKFSLDHAAQGGDALPRPVEDNESRPFLHERSCKISNKSHSKTPSGKIESNSEEKETSSREGISAEQIMELILSEQCPDSAIPEGERRTRLVYKSGDREIHQVSFPNDSDGEPVESIFFEVNSQTSTPIQHGISQGLDDY